MNLDALANEPRLLIEVSLKPLQGTRFQPTGFPDLGAATYNLADGRQMLLVESAQSMANHMEKWCWDEANAKPITTLDGMPYIESTLPDGCKTSSLLESHRLNSPYIVNSQKFADIEQEIGFKKNQPFDRQKLVKVLCKYDPNSLIHGVFLEKVGGVVRLPRALTAFVEASNVTTAANGGAKFDRIQPGTKEEKVTPYGKAEDGYGNVIFPRDDYTGDIKAYFNLDLALIEGFDLPSEAKEFLVVLSLLKIRRFLCFGLRLRSGCDLDIVQTDVTRPQPSWMLPDMAALTTRAAELIMVNTEMKHFADPFKTAVAYDTGIAKARKKAAPKQKAESEAELS
jgi:CRISPR-associated protein Csb1